MIIKLLLNTQMIWRVFIKILKKYNPNKNRKTLIVFDDMIADMLNDKKLSSTVTELFIKVKKTKHFSCFYYKILFCCTEKY